MPLALGLLFMANVVSPVFSVPIHYEEPDPKEIWMDALAQCESHGSTTVRVWDVNDRWSVGKYQYQYATWLTYSKKFGTTKENITDGDLQDLVTRHILDNGGWKNWYNCGKKLNASIGAYPSE